MSMFKHGYASSFGTFSSVLLALFFNLKLLTKNIQLTNSISLAISFKLNDLKLPVNTTGKFSTFISMDIIEDFLAPRKPGSSWSFYKVMRILLQGDFGSSIWGCGWNPALQPLTWELLRPVLSRGVVYYALQGVSNFICYGLKPKVKTTVRWKTHIWIQNQLVD